MLQWCLFETDKISRLREKLRNGHTILMVVQAQAQECVILRSNPEKNLPN